ncbi:MAG: carboxypeptidase regulatory-like domain-containing protein [bacterium]
MFRRMLRRPGQTLLSLLLVLSSGLGSVLVPLPVRAASTVTVTTSGLINGEFAGSPVPASSPAIAVLKLSVTASSASQSLSSVTVNFSGSGLVQGDFEAIATGASSGVALYNDGGGTAGSLDGTDSVVVLAGSPGWTGETTGITLTPAAPVSLVSGTPVILYVVIKTSAALVDGHRIVASVPANGVVTSDGNGPASTFTAFDLRADTAPAQITQVNGFVGNAVIDVLFNKPVQKVGGGNLLTTSFTYVDGGGAAQTISSISHTAGQNFARLTMSAALDAEDLDGTPATVAAASNAVADMGGNVVGTSAVELGSPIDITTSTIPTAIVGTGYTTGSPLVAFAAAGGTAPYTFAANAEADSTVLSNAGLAIVNDGGTYKITGTVLDVPGSYPLYVKVTDSSGTPQEMTRRFTLNVGQVGGVVPGITSVVPGAAPVGASAMTVGISGSATSFSPSSTVQFLSGGAPDAAMTATVVAASSTTLTLSVNVGGGATTGPHDVRVTTGGEIVELPGGFGIFPVGDSGLNLQNPTDTATGISMPPNFNFSPSSNVSAATYRITIKSTSNFSGTALWDYAFPKPADVNNSNGSHCTATGCDIGYGAGSFRIITQPTPLSPNTTYYWQVRTYSQSPDGVSDAVSPLEGTSVRSFTTITAMADIMPPNIRHRPVFQATASSDLNLFARIDDNLATTTTTPALSATINYCAGAGCDPSSGTQAAGTFVGNGYFRFTVPGATVGVAGTVVRYYLSASDGTNTATFYDFGSTPFTLTSVAAGASSIAGTVHDGSDACPAGVQGATVFAEGTGFTATTDGSCAYTLSGLSAGIYDVVALKSGYSDRVMNGIPAGSSGIAFRLPEGFGGGFGGDGTKPHVMFTGPGDNMSNIPGGDPNFLTFLVFDKPMSQTSITTTGNLTVNEINQATGELTDITSKGSWTYYPTTVGLDRLPPVSYAAAFSFSQSGCGGAPCSYGDGKTIAVIVSGSVTDTSGNPVMGNQPDGSYSFTFSTGTTYSGSFAEGETFGTGEFIPPHVTGMTPPPGSLDVPIDRKIVVSFSDAMADDTVGTYLLKSFIKIYSVSGTTETDVSSSLISSTSLDATKRNATLTLTGSLTASTRYRLKVLAGAKAATGLTIGPPNSGSTVMFTGEFKTGTGTDVGAPTVTGTFPDASATNVPVNLNAVNVGFSKDMDASTISTSTVYLSIGSTSVNGTVEYRPFERTAFFVPRSALNANTTYTLNVTTGVQALNGTALASSESRTFTTGSADSAAPSVQFGNADDFSLAVTFSEPMNAARATDTLNFAASVLKPANWTLKYATVGEDSSAGTAITVPSSATFNYDQVTNTVEIAGYHGDDLTPATLRGKELYVVVTGVKDLSGNSIATDGGANTAKMVILNSADTQGALGPMGMSGDAFSGQGGFVPDNFDSGTFGFAPPVEVRPFNTMPGQITTYGIRLPVSQQIPSGGAIVVTFPVGFDVSAARQDVNSPMRQDLNGPGSGTVTFKCNPVGAPTGASCSGTANADDTGAAQGGLAGDGVVVDTASRSVKVYLSAATNVEGHDFLSIDIAGIKNATVPKDMNTSGYTADVKTKNGTTLVESLTSMPFFIQSGGSGSFTLSGTITATGNVASGTMKVYLFSPLTGPLEATTADFSGGETAAYSFSLLPAGDYMISTDQTVLIDSAEFVGKSMPERVAISANTTYNMTLASVSAGGTAVTVNVTGPANEPLDIFAGSPTGFRVRQITLNGGGTGTTTLNLPDGEWSIGVGPQMPKGFTGAPPAPSYLPPRNKQAKIANPACTIDGSVTCTAAFTLTASDKTIRGLVKDGSGRVIANAEVFAYSPNGGFGTHAQSATDGSFTLNVVDGSYVVGAFVPGMPNSKEVPVVVTSHATTYLLLDGATTAITPAAAATSFILKVAKPDYTISGRVTDGTSVVKGASVYAYKTNGPGHADVLTDSSGNYTLYVSAGTWNVGTFLPQYGRLAEQSVTVSTANVTSINFSPSQTGTGTFYTVSGSVTSGGSPVVGAFVRIAGNSTNNEVTTGTDGAYSMRVPACATASCYTLKAFAPGIGELPPLTPFSLTSDASGKNFAVAAPRTVTVTFSSPVTRAFIDMFATTGSGAHVDVVSSATGTLSLPDGSYRVRIDAPGMSISPSDISGDGYNSSTGVFTVSAANIALSVTLPTLRTITGTVTDGADNIANAWVEVVDPTNGIHFGAQTDSTSAPGTNFSLTLADGTYFINAMKPGYFRQPTTLVVNGATPAQTITLSSASTTISGQVLIGSSGASNAFVRGDKIGGGFSGTQADANGNYVLPVDSGLWKVYAVAEGYQEAGYTSNPIDVTGGSVIGKNITLATAVNVAPPQSRPITPASGGTIEDDTAGLRMTIPANALGTSSSSGMITARETNNVRSTNTANVVMVYDAQTNSYIPVAKDVSATDADGNPITNLDDSISLEMDYTVAELAATRSATDSSIDTRAEAEMLTMAYWDATNQSWTALPSTVTFRDSDRSIVNEPADNLSNVSIVTVSATTDHFSLYAPIVSTDPSAPSTPSGLAATAVTTARIDLSWTQTAGATGYDIYRSTSSGGTYTRLGSEPTVSSGSTVSYSDTGLNSSTTYYYKISAVNGSGESASSSAVSDTTQSGGSSNQAATVTLSLPNGGEVITAGSTYRVMWGTGGSNIQGVDVLLSTDGGSTFQTTVASMVGNNGYYDWSVPSSLSSATARIRVEAVVGGSVAASDSSEENFIVRSSGSGSNGGGGGGGGGGSTPASDSSTSSADGDSSEAESGSESFEDTESSFPTGTHERVAYSADEMDAPSADPNMSGAFDRSLAVISTPTIDVDLGILPPPVEIRLPCVGGSLFKTAGSPAVYYCGKNGRRYVFPNQNVYSTWFEGFGGVLTVSPDDLAAAPLGGNVNYRPGVRMIKVQSDPKVYAVSRNGLLRWVSSEEQARSLYGDDWNRQIDDLNPAFFFSYSIGDPIGSGE